MGMQVRIATLVLSKDVTVKELLYNKKGEQEEKARSD